MFYSIAIKYEFIELFFFSMQSLTFRLRKKEITQKKKNKIREDLLKETSYGHYTKKLFKLLFINQRERKGEKRIARTHTHTDTI